MSFYSLLTLADNTKGRGFSVASTTYNGDLQMKLMIEISDDTLTPHTESLLVEKIRVAIEDFGIDWDDVAFTDGEDSESEIDG